MPDQEKLTTAIQDGKTSDMSHIATLTSPVELKVSEKTIQQLETAGIEYGIISQIDPNRTSITGKGRADVQSQKLVNAGFTILSEDDEPRADVYEIVFNTTPIDQSSIKGSDIETEINPDELIDKHSVPILKLSQERDQLQKEVDRLKSENNHLRFLKNSNADLQMKLEEEIEYWKSRYETISSGTRARRPKSVKVTIKTLVQHLGPHERLVDADAELAEYMTDGWKVLGNIATEITSDDKIIRIVTLAHREAEIPQPERHITASKMIISHEPVATLTLNDQISVQDKHAFQPIKNAVETIIGKMGGTS